MLAKRILVPENRDDGRFENKKGRLDLPFLYALSEKLFLSVLHVRFVTVHELINTSCGVDQFDLTGIERV